MSDALYTVLYTLYEGFVCYPQTFAEEVMEGKPMIDIPISTQTRRRQGCDNEL